MARIDLYLKSITRFGASGAIFASGSNVTLKFATGDRYASQSTSHDELVAMVEEVAPPSLLATLRRGSRATFDHPFESQTYRVEVEPAATRWRVAVAFVVAEEARTPRADVRRDPMPAPKGNGAAAPVPAPAPVAAAESGPHGSGPGVVEKLLVKMHGMGASDLHLATGSPPRVRLHGEIKTLEGYPAASADTLLAQLLEIAPERNRAEFAERNDTDFACAIPGVARFRANMFRDRVGPGAVFRAIPFQIRSPADLGLPRHVLELCKLNKGLVVVTGPTGSGKSTTLATLIDHVNMTRHDHIITVEDPIEFLHENKKCLVNQREVHVHTRSFKDALRAALREDPDIVLVGEMRDLETIAIAVETAETGHLVFGTLHTTTAPSTVDRIIDQFPPDRQEQIRNLLAESLRGVIAQVLCKKVGGGRVAAYEILLGSSAVANLIRERKTFQLFSVMQTGRGQGMVTLNDSLLELVQSGQVDVREAYLKSVNRAEFKSLLTREGIKLNTGDN